MDRPLSPLRSFSPGRVVTVLASVLVGLVACVLVAAPPARPVATPLPSNPLVRWRDAGHDWLLVTDRRRDELVVYDARDGRPLYRQRLQDVGRRGSLPFDVERPAPLTPLAAR